MLILLGIILLTVSTVLLIARPYYGFLMIIMSKPIIDMTWQFRPGGFSLIQMASVILPVLLLPRLLQSAYWKDPKHRVWMVLGIMIFIGQFVPSIVSLLQDTMVGFDSIFRSLNVFLAFLMIPAFATNDKRLKQILLAFIIAGLAPLAVSIYSELTGTVWRVRTTIGLERNIGLYHNAVSIRHFGLQSILVSLMYLQLFTPKKLIIKLALFTYLLLSTYMLYRGYTRGGLATLALWAVIWVIVYRKFHWGLISAAGLVAVDFYTKGALSAEVIQLFSKEVDFYEGGFTDNRKVLNGRIGLWQEDIRIWAEQSRTNQFFGGYYTGLGTHNEFLRSLLGNGLFGLALYTVSIVSIGLWSAAKLLSGEAARYAIFAVMIMAMYAVEAAGATPGAFPQYQWFVFGFIGTFLLNARRLGDSQPERRPQRESNQMIDIADYGPVPGRP